MAFAFLNLGFLAVFGTCWSLNCYSCTFTQNGDIIEGDEENTDCKRGASYLTQFSRPCLASHKYCKMELVSLGWSFIGLLRECAETCYDVIREKSYGLTIETRIRCCDLSLSGTNCNGWNASSTYTNIDWMGDQDGSTTKEDIKYTA